MAGFYPAMAFHGPGSCIRLVIGGGGIGVFGGLGPDASPAPWLNGHCHGEAAIAGGTHGEHRGAARESVGGQIDSAATDSGVIRKLNSAIARDDLDAVQQLLAAGVDINARDDDRQTPLAAAAIAGRVELIDLLIANGANVNLRDKAGRTALTQAVEAGHDEVAELLRQHGAVR